MRAAPVGERSGHVVRTLHVSAGGDEMQSLDPASSPLCEASREWRARHSGTLLEVIDVRTSPHKKKGPH